MDIVLKSAFELAAEIAGIPGVDTCDADGRFLSFRVVEFVSLARRLDHSLRSDQAAINQLKEMVLEACRGMAKWDYLYKATLHHAHRLLFELEQCHKDYPVVAPPTSGPAEPVVRKCNLHADCDEADKAVQEHRGVNAFHCTDPKCQAYECSRNRT